MAPAPAPAPAHEAAESAASVERVLQPTQLGRGHPDQEWIEQARAALDRWAAIKPNAPTSSVLGSGAITAAEAELSRLHEGRPALLLPSATYALRVGLQTLGVTAGDEVICSGIDWPAGFAAIASLGATPVPVAVDPRTLTIDPAAAATSRTGRTRAIVACHLHGVCADILAIRRLLPGVGVLEDAAQAFGSRIDGRLAGTLADAAVLSLGPGKQIDAGEAGVLLCDEAARHERAIAIACHPLRGLLAGVQEADPAALSIRPHPMAAILALHRLARWRPTAEQSAHAEMARHLAADVPVRILAIPGRHLNCQPYVPVLVAADRAERPPGWQHWPRSGAQVMSGLTATDHELAASLLGRVRLVTGNG